jgi:hypothetical protein
MWQSKCRKIVPNEIFHDFLISLSAVQIRSTTKVVHDPQLYPIAEIVACSPAKVILNFVIWVYDH